MVAFGTEIPLKSFLVIFLCSKHLKLAGLRGAATAGLCGAATAGLRGAATAADDHDLISGPVAGLEREQQCQGTSG